MKERYSSEQSIIEGKSELGKLLLHQGHFAFKLHILRSEVALLVLRHQAIASVRVPLKGLANEDVFKVLKL